MKKISITLFLLILSLTITSHVIGQESFKSNSVVTEAGTADPAQKPAEDSGTINADGMACPIKAKYVPFTSYTAIKQDEFSFACAHHLPIFNAIDVGTSPSGGTEVVATVDGVASDLSSPGGGPSVFLAGKDGKYYFYLHLQRDSMVFGNVTAGQVIGRIAAANDASSANNGTAHVHFEYSTDPNKHNKNNPTNDPAGPLLDKLCNINVCNGQPNRRL